RGDDAVRRHPADDVVPGVGDVEVPGRVHRHATGSPQRGGGGRATVAAGTGRAGSGHGGGDAGGRHRADAAGVRGGGGEGPGVGAGAGDGGDDAIGRHLADAVVVRIGDVEVAGRVHRHARGAVQLGRGGGPTVAAEAGRLHTRHGGDGAVGRHLADAAAVGDV